MKQIDIEQLRTIDILEDVEDGVINELSKRIWEVQGNEGSPIYFPNDSAGLVYLIKDGRVRIFYQVEEGRRITVDFLGNGEIFGELSLADVPNHGVASEALTETDLLVVPSDHFNEVMSRSPDFTRKMFDYVSNRRWKIQNRLKGLMFDNARKRLIYVLLDLAESSVSESEERHDITLEFSHAELAQMAGLARPTTTKLLNTFSEEELLTLSQRSIVIPDMLPLQEELGPLARAIKEENEDPVD